MISQLKRSFERLDRDIRALSYFLICLTLVLVVRAMFLAYQGIFEEMWSLLGPLGATTAALLASRAATRLITNSNLVREDERRLEIVRVTHHLLAIAQDLKARVSYIKTMFESPTHPVFALVQIAETIERRYETLLERDAYRFLPGDCVDIIVRMSGSVFGIGALAEGIKSISDKSPVDALFHVLPPDDDQKIIPSVDRLIQDLDALIDKLYELRLSLDPK